MLVIRLQRIGKKHQPSYRVVVAERRSKLIAPPMEDLGSYIPMGKKLGVKPARVEYWLGKGAKATPTVHNLLVSNKVISTPKIAIKINKPKAESAPAA
jgi:small subunit ribosomal protein S16